MASHEIFEKNSIVLALAIVVVVAIAGLVQIRSEERRVGKEC